MSVIGKIPTLELIISRLPDNLLSDLKEALNGGYGEIIRSLTIKDKLISSQDKGIKSCILDGRSGLLIYNDYTELGATHTQSYFIRYGSHQRLGILRLDLLTNTFTEINENCTLEELRRILNDYLEVEKAESAIRVIPTEILGNGSEIMLSHDGNPLTGQTPLSFKTINNESIIGQGDINTHELAYDVLTEVSTGILKSTYTYSHHTLVAFEVETQGVHYGADFILHPYDGVSVCLVAFRIILNGSFADAYANLDENGHIVITLTGQIPSGAIFKCHTLEFVD